MTGWPLPMQTTGRLMRPTTAQPLMPALQRLHRLSSINHFFGIIFIMISTLPSLSSLPIAVTCGLQLHGRHRYLHKPV
jgi:hypothetical protein